MTKNTGRLDQLFALHLNQSATELEQEEFWGYVNDPMYEREVQELIAALYSESDNVSMIAEEERAVILAEVFSTKRIPAPVIAVKTRKINLWPRIAIAAAVATIIFGAGLFYYNLNNDHQQLDQVALKNDVAPGKTGATLTLASGKKIRLSDAANGELAKEAGVVISKSADGQLVYEIKGSKNEPNKINTLSTAKGETYKVRLPDGSLVWLNAASTLTYSAALNERGVRRVKLDGEGYFEIARDKVHPFIVATDKQEVEVLGTHFNVNAYGNESGVRTTLLEGSVSITPLSPQGGSLPLGERGAKSKVNLKPGEQAQFSNNQLSINKTADLEEATAWKNGYFKFSDNLETIMHKISRWYDVDIVYNMKPDPEYAFGGEISRSRNLSEVLKVMEYSGKVHFKIEGRRIIVNK